MMPFLDPKAFLSSPHVAMSEPYQHWFKSATRKILLVLHADKRCSGTLASLVLAAGFAVTDPTVQAAFTGIASAVVMLRDFVTDASFRLGVEMSEHVPLVVGRASSQAPSNPAACDETALTVWAGFAAASSHQVRFRAVTVLCHCTVQNLDVAFDQIRH